MQGTNNNLKEKIRGGREGQGQADKAKEEVEKAREEAKQHGYDIGMAKTKDALRAKAPGVCSYTATKCGMKPLTDLGLRLPLRLGKQKTFTTLKPSAFHPPTAINQILLPKWPI